MCAYTTDRWDDLSAAVRSALAQDPAPLEVLLVIDHNAELLTRAESGLSDLPGVRVLASTEHQGLSGARNTGVRAAGGDVVVFLDDDARCDPHWAAALLRPYADPQVVGVGGHVVPDWRAPRPAWMPEEFLWVVGCSFRGQPEGEARVRNGIGANLSFRRSVLESIGGFSPLVGRVGADAAGCEETELSIRAVESVPGGAIVLVPDAVVRHAVTPARTTRSYFRARCRAEGRSKAIVSSLVGSGSALSTERTYVTHTLPTAVLRGLRPRAGRPAAPGQSVAVVEGLVLTATAYAGQLLRQRVRPVTSDPATAADAAQTAA
ncbi:hypothetical protein GCM10028814_23400 [Angustibacter aerolatus]